jgi:hypothetical protein
MQQPCKDAGIDPSLLAYVAPASAATVAALTHKLQRTRQRLQDKKLQCHQLQAANDQLVEQLLHLKRLNSGRSPSLHLQETLCLVAEQRFKIISLISLLGQSVSHVVLLYLSIILPPLIPSPLIPSPLLSS